MRRSPVLRTRGGARRGVLRRRAAGSGRSGTRPTRRWSRSTASRPRAARVGRALVVADHQRRAPRDARAASAWSTSPRSRVRHQRTRRARLRCSTSRVQQRRRAGRARRLHAAAHAPTAASAATSRSCASATTHFRVVTGAFDGMARPATGSAKHLPDDGSVTFTDMTTALDDDRRCGARTRARHPRRSRSRSDDVSHAGFPYGAVPDDRDRLAARARVPHLLRRRARLGDLRADRAGRCACGTCSGRPASAFGIVAVRHRRVRHDRTDREGLRA